MQKDGLSIGGSSSSMGALQQFVADGNEVLKFRLIRSEADLNPEAEIDFQPEMCHQIYGENENIFGYRNLSVKLYMSASTLKVFLTMSADETISSSRSQGLDPDPVIPPLLKLLAPDQAIVDNLDEFRNYVNSDVETKFVPFGEKIAAFDSELNGQIKTYEIFLADEKIPGFRDFHSRLQPWIMFYIDAASYIDIDDGNWRFFILYEKYTDAEGRNRFAVAGYTTVYQYYAYPQNVRPRISQVLVLPPFQRQGLGAKMLDAVSRHFWNDRKVVDITVEDPSEEFVRLRDFIDVKNGLELITNFQKPDKVKAGFSKEMEEECREKMKLCARQSRRVYEIIRLHWTKKSCPLTDSPSNADYKNYRLDIKKRLNLPFQKEDRQLSRLKKVLKPEEYSATTAVTTDRSMRLQTLETQYKELEEHYLNILERLASE